MGQILVYNAKNREANHKWWFVFFNEKMLRIIKKTANIIKKLFQDFEDSTERLFIYSFKKEQTLKKAQSRAIRYSFAIAVVVIVTAVKFVATKEADVEAPFLLFFSAVMISAWFGGLGSGIVATLLSTFIAGTYFFNASIWGFDFGNKPLQLSIFIMEGLVISLLSEVRIRADSRLRENEKRKEDFIKLAAHELKTPITTLKVYTQYLQKKVIKRVDPFFGVVTQIDTQIDRLSQLVNDLINASNIQSANYKLKPEKFDLQQLAREAIINMQGTLNTHSINLCEGPQAVIKADKENIREVMLNLLNNSVKYSPGKNRVDVKIVPNGQSVEVSIRDYGLGIDSTQSDKIFDIFYRINHQDEETFSGLGMGLYICSEIIKKHGGKIWFNSQRNRGTTFHFTLPKYPKNED